MNNPHSEAYLLYRKGKTCMNEGNYADAIGAFTEALAHQPHFKSLELLGECYMLIGKSRDAIIPLAAAASLNKGPRASSLLAEALLDAGEVMLATDAVENALKRDPKNRRALEVQRKLSSSKKLNS